MSEDSRGPKKGTADNQQLYTVTRTMCSSFGMGFHRASLILSVACTVLVMNVFGPLTCLAGRPNRVCLVDRALETIAMQRSDLSIRSDLYASPFVLSHFSRWMESPLEAPKEAQYKAMNLLRVANDPYSWIQQLAQLGDLHSIGPTSLKEYTRAKLPAHIPAPLKESIHLLLDAIYSANITIAAIRDKISPEEMELLKKYVYPHSCKTRDSGEQTGELSGLKGLRQAIGIAGSVDRKGMLEAGLTIVRALAKARELLKEKHVWQDNVSSFSLMTDLGLVKVGATGSDVHEEHAALIIDLGGNDLYKGKVASGTDGSCSLVLDLEGNDVYLGQEHTQASGVWGIGILFDLGGNDLYTAGGCSQGAGLFGMGLLMDAGGRDSYIGTRFVQAASSWGWGGLIDLDGEDTYQCEHSGQAYSETLGISSLCDLKGNDKYISGSGAPDPRETDMSQSFSQGFSVGMRNVAAGGFALLADKSGNDFYQCQYFGQGASYWMGIGILYDENGKDTYIARRYAQGAGIHFSLGLLMDVGGNDHTSSWGVSQGCGHDYGIGVLVNEIGNDTYVSDWLSMGASEANGVGIFVDNSGNDGYETNSGPAVGNFAKWRRAGGIGLFVDAGGTDRYSKIGSDNSVWALNRWGVGIDNDDGVVSGMNILSTVTAPAIDEEVEKRKLKEKIYLSQMLARSEAMPHPMDIEGMLSVASHWGLERDIPKKAREKLLGLAPEKSVPAMVKMLDTPNITSLSFMGRFFAVHAFWATPELIKKTTTPDPLIKERAFYYLGLLKDSRALEDCVEALKEPLWRIRSAAISALGEILDKRRLQVLIPMRAAFDEALKKNDRRIVRGYLEDVQKVVEVLSVLARATSVEYQRYMRYAEMPSDEKKETFINDFVALAFGHLDKMLPLVDRWITDIDRSDAIAEKLMPYLTDHDPAVRKATAYSLGQMNYESAIPKLLSLLKDPHLWVRDATVLSLALFGADVLNRLGSAMERETGSFKILALDVLARIKGHEARALIERHLDDSNENVRRAARQNLQSWQ